MCFLINFGMFTCSMLENNIIFSYLIEFRSDIKKDMRFHCKFGLYHSYHYIIQPYKVSIEIVN